MQPSPCPWQTSQFVLATPLQLPLVCIENFIMSCCKINPVFPVTGFIFPTQPYFSLSFIQRCTTFGTELFPEVAAPSPVPGAFPAAGFPLLVSPQESKHPAQEQDLSSLLIHPHGWLSLSLQSVEGNGPLIHLNHCWYPFSVGVKEILGAAAAIGGSQGPPDGTSSMMVPAPGEPRASWDASHHLFCFFAKSCTFYKLFFLLHSRGL